MTDPVVEIQSGSIRGIIKKHEDGFDYYAFKGIPYAEPPIGDLRFEDPVPIRKWTGTLDCKNYGPTCAQFDMTSRITFYDEDCLHLNVYTRVINEPRERKAVMVWSHFGNFAIGNSSDMYYGPDYLIRKDVVLVTINARVGLLGYLNLQDPIAPGNQGLRDKLMALQWVQQNIHVFGGDPGNVTFGGTAAGGASAHYLALSPLAKGLMHKIISQSASVYNPWATVKTPKKNAIKLCSLLGKDLEEPSEIKGFLKMVDITVLVDAFIRLWKVTDDKPFGPGIDDKSTNPVVPIDRYYIADQGINLPCLLGHNSRDGLVFLSGKAMPKKQYFEKGNEDFNNILLYNTKEILERYDLSVAQAKRLYYKSEAVTEKNLDNFVDYNSDLHFHQAVHRFARVQAEQSSAPTYMYIFNFDQPDKLGTFFYEEKLDGVCLIEELSFLFKMGLFDQVGMEHWTKGTKAYRVMEQMTEMWTNFAKYGRPTIELSELIPIHWKPISNGSLLHYMSIDEDLTMQNTVNIEEKLLSARQIVA